MKTILLILAGLVSTAPEAESAVSRARTSSGSFSTFFASELFDTGETKSGFGLRGRYWFNEFGVEAQGLSLTPRDELVDRSDLSACYKLTLAEQWTGVASVGYGVNIEDSEHGPGAGAGLQYHRGQWFGELGGRWLGEHGGKGLFTVGIGRSW